MCGLAGFLSLANGDELAMTDVLRRMTDAVKHRGPDDSGTFVDAAAGIALGHRRLSVIDLSPAGHQPMFSASGRFVLVFNGEIYNHADLRRELADVAWRGHSDTETALAAVERWGLARTLQRAVGMFALAIWDKDARILSLARDRMGEKPLYCGQQGGTFLFGSELKALRLHPDFRTQLDRSALDAYVRNGFVPAPKSIFVGIRKLEPGAILQVKASASAIVEHSRSQYWSLRDVVEDSPRFTGTRQEAVTRLEALLRSAVAGQQLADVPVGAFLSGGTDSSAIVALMQAISTKPIKTFSVGFREKSYDEAHYARKVAEHLGTDHTELYVSPEAARDLIPALPTLYDEPFADSSQLPMALVARLARRHVTVALSGDGGDELFCGYGRYEHTRKVWKQLSVVPLTIRKAVPSALLPPARRAGFKATSIDSFYAFVNAQWKAHPELVVGRDPPAEQLQDIPQTLVDGRERMMYVDAHQYLPDDILVKVDRAAMAVSLETRVPLLDHRVVEFAWQLPIEYKVYDGIAKWPLKQIVYKHLPEPLVNRPKMGFGVPIDSWLRGPLRGWAEELLAESRLRSDGFFAPQPIRDEWNLHLSGNRDRHYGLWTILMFQAWVDNLHKTA